MAATTTAFENELRTAVVGDPTNVFANPSMQLGIADWQVSTLCTIAWGAPGTGSYGDRALVVTTTAAGTTCRFRGTDAAAPAAVIDTAFTAAATVKNPGLLAGRRARMYMQYLDAANVALGSVSFGPYGDLAVDGSPTVIPAMTVVARSPAAKLRVAVEINAPGTFAAGEIYNVDGLIAVLGDATPGYFDGDSPGCVWTGTPHASPSRTLNSFPNPPRGLMAGAALKLRRLYLDGVTDPLAHTIAKSNPRQLKALTDNSKLASFDAITAP